MRTADPGSRIFLILVPMETFGSGVFIPDPQHCSGFRTPEDTEKSETRASNLPAQQSQGGIPRQVRRQGQAPHVCRRQAANRRKKGGGGRRTQRRKLLRGVEQRRPGKASQARRQRRRLFGKQAERSRQPRVGVGHRWQGGGEGEGVAAAAVAVVPLRNTQG
jgi:hypothetical protein